MEKLKITILMLSSIIQITHANSPNPTDKTPKSIQNWYKTVSNSEQKVTHLHFYLHDIVSGPSPTTIPIATANSTATSPTYFGLISAMDDLLTSGPSPDSEVLGRAQGLLGSTSLEEMAYHMTMSFVFTSGEFNGSTLSVVGHNPFLHERRELSVVGGSGHFRLARGTAVLSTLTTDNESGDAVVEYDVVILHY